MNTPFGNSITTAEHAMALLLSRCRGKFRRPTGSTQARQVGKIPPSWASRSPAKTLGVIGCGNIGSVAAAKAASA